MKNEIETKIPFEIRAESLKKRTKEFFSTYENPTGSEDRLEICLIREGYRAVLLAEEEINRLKEENTKLQLSIGMTSDKYRVGRIEAKAYREFAHALKTYFRLRFLRRKCYDKIIDEVVADLLKRTEGTE